ncbi:MAG: GNAT family N-acetyltransferase [Bacillota bacterium]
MTKLNTQLIEAFAQDAAELYKSFIGKYPFTKLMFVKTLLHSSGNIGLIVLESGRVVGKYSVFSSSEGFIVKGGIDKGICVIYKLQLNSIYDIINNRDTYHKHLWKLMKYGIKLANPIVIKERASLYGVLKGANVLLRPCDDSDMKYLVEWYNDYELNRLAGWTSSRVTEARLRYNYSKSYGYDPMNLIIDNECGKPIGTIQLYDFSDLDKSCKLGIRIGDKQSWGKGYGEAAVNVLLEYAFMKLELNRVSLRVYEFNERAVRCYLKCGFQHEGTARKSAYIDGAYYDEILMGILKSEFIRTHSK